MKKLLSAVFILLVAVSAITLIPTVASAERATISEIEISGFKEPAANESIEYLVTLPADAGYIVSEIFVLWRGNNVTGTYNCGEQYYLIVKLKVDDYHVFGKAYEMHATVNGRPAEIEADGTAYSVRVVCYFDALPDHQFVDESVQASCETPGYFRRYCTVCGNTFQDYSSPAKGHDYVRVPEEYANCQKSGNLPYYKCLVCDCTFDEKYVKQPIESFYLPVNPENHATSLMIRTETEHYYVCVCGVEFNRAPHEVLSWTTDYAPTYDKEGLEYGFCSFSDCGYRVERAIPKLVPETTLPEETSSPEVTTEAEISTEPEVTTSPEVTTAEVTTAEITTAEVTTAENTTAEITTADVTSAAESGVRSADTTSPAKPEDPQPESTEKQSGEAEKESNPLLVPVIVVSCLLAVSLGALGFVLGKFVFVKK